MARTTHALTITIPPPPNLSPSALLSHLHTLLPLFRAQDYVHTVEPIPTSLPDVQQDDFFRSDGLHIQSFSVKEAIPLVPGTGWTKDLSFPAVCQSHESGVRVRADAPAGVRVWAEYEVRRGKGSGGLDGSRGLDGARGIGGEGGRFGYGSVGRNGGVAALGFEGERKGGYARGEMGPLSPNPMSFMSPEEAAVAVNGHANGGRIDVDGEGEGGVFELVEHVKVECNSLLMPFVSRSMEGAHRELCQKIMSEIMGK